MKQVKVKTNVINPEFGEF